MVHNDPVMFRFMIRRFFRNLQGGRMPRFFGDERYDLAPVCLGPWRRKWENPWEEHGKTSSFLWEFPWEFDISSEFRCFIKS